MLNKEIKRKEMERIPINRNKNTLEISMQFTYAGRRELINNRIDLSKLKEEYPAICLIETW